MSKSSKTISLGTDTILGITTWNNAVTEKDTLKGIKEAEQNFNTAMVYCPLFKCEKLISKCDQCNLTEALCYILETKKYMCDVEVNGVGNNV